MHQMNAAVHHSINHSVVVCAAALLLLL